MSVARRERRVSSRFAVMTHQMASVRYDGASASK
jgi:hypothetical protein